MSFVYYVCYTLSLWLARLFFQFTVIHRERIIENGPAILAVNHQSHFDPPLAGICSKRGVCYLARKTLLDVPILGKLLPHLNVIPVERDGNDMSALKSVIKRIRQGDAVVLFPEGTRSADGSLQPGRAGIGLVIAKTRAPVIPMRIFGSQKAFPRGAKLPKLEPITVVIGEPLHFSEKDVAGAGRDTYQRLSDRVMAAIAALQIP